MISAVPSSNPTFVARNFTDAEIAYCRSQPSPEASFAARWTGKEAVFKSLGVSSKGAAAAMKDIEILPNEAGAPTVTLHGDAKAAADDKGITKIHISLSHSEVCFFFRCPIISFAEFVFLDCCYRFRTSYFYLIIIISFTDSLRTRFLSALLGYLHGFFHVYSSYRFYVSMIVYCMLCSECHLENVIQ